MLVLRCIISNDIINAMKWANVLKQVLLMPLNKQANRDELMNWLMIDWPLFWWLLVVSGIIIVGNWVLEIVVGTLCWYLGEHSGIELLVTR